MKTFLSATLVIAMLFLMPFGLAQGESTDAVLSPGINEAIVIVNNEQIVMKAVSVETNVDTGYCIATHTVYPNKGIFDPITPYDQLFSYTTEYLVSAKMDTICFEQKDKRTGVLLKELKLLIPANWEAGNTYSSKDEDKLYGAFMIYYRDHQTGCVLNPAAMSQKRSNVSLIIDKTDADYSLIKGRFKGDITPISNTVTFELSSFHVDKNSLSQDAPKPNDDDPVFPDLN